MGHANTGKVQAPFLYIRVGSFFDERGVCGGGEGCVFRLSHSGIYSVGNEFGSGEAC